MRLFPCGLPLFTAHAYDMARLKTTHLRLETFGFRIKVSLGEFRVIFGG